MKFVIEIPWQFKGLLYSFTYNSNCFVSYELTPGPSGRYILQNIYVRHAQAQLGSMLYCLINFFLMEVFIFNSKF